MTVGITAHGVFRPFPDLVERSLEDRWALDVLAFGISVHARFFDSAVFGLFSLIMNFPMLSSPQLDGVDTRIDLISELDGLPAFPSIWLLHPTCYHVQRTSQGQSD